MKAIQVLLATIFISSASPCSHDVPASLASLVADDMNARVTAESDGRRLQLSCSLILSATKAIYSNALGVESNCTCDSVANTEYNVTCNSAKAVCCGETCGTVETTLRIGNDYGKMRPVSDSNCVNYTSGLSGTRCSRSIYCSSGTSVCGCNITLNNKQCQSCTPCSPPDKPLSDLMLATYDCSNLPDAEDVVATECESIVNLFEVGCESPVAPTTSGVSSLLMQATTVMLLGLLIVLIA
jgi:hypothetical protein